VVRSCARGSRTGRFCNAVSELADIVGEVGAVVRAVTRGVIVFAQANAWRNGDLGEGRSKAWVYRVLAVWK